MRAIIETGGKQFSVAPEETIRVPSLEGKPGDEVTLDRVLYAADGGDVRIGDPEVDGARVTAEIVRHGRGRKITVLRFKRRKRYRRKTGHRQGFTELRITGLELGRQPTKKREEAKAEAPAGQAAEAGEAGVFVCEICGKEYGTERGLKVHVTRSHSE